MIYVCMCCIYLGKGIQVPALPWPCWPGSGSGWGESVRRVSQSQSFALSVLSHKGKYKQDDYLACATVSLSARVCVCVCVWLYLTVSLTVCAAGSAQLLWHWLSRWAKQCVGPWSWVSGSWVRSWVVGLGLCLCPGSLSLCLSRVLVLSLVLELELLPVALLSVLRHSRPLSATWLNCLDLSRFAVFILRSAMSAGCLSVYLSVRPPLGLPPCSSSFLLFFLPYFHLTPTLLVLGVSISGCLPVPSVCLSLSPTACRPSVYFGHPQSYFLFSQVIESTQILLV